MIDVRDLHQALFLAQAAVARAVELSRQVPDGHRVTMARSQLESSADCLKRAQGFLEATQSGTWTLAKTKPPPKDPREEPE